MSGFWCGFFHGLALLGWLLHLPVYCLGGKGLVRWKADRPRIENWR